MGKIIENELFFSVSLAFSSNVKRNAFHFSKIYCRAWDLRKWFHLETLPSQKCAQNRGSGIRGKGGYTVDLR